MTAISVVFDHKLGDARLEKRANRILHQMIKSGSGVPNRLNTHHRERMGMSRFLNNNRLSMDALVNSITQSWYTEEYADRDLYVIQDTTDYNAIGHKGRISESDEDLGPLWKDDTNQEFGFFLHPGLVLDGDSGFPLGYTHLHIWNRCVDQPNRHERNYKRQPIEQKSSYRWLESIDYSTQVLKGHRGKVVHVMDREGDIYELFAKPMPPNHHLVIRTSKQRVIYDESDSKHLLWQYLEEQATKGLVIEVAIPRQKKRKARKAKMALSYGRVEIARPKDRTKAQGPDRIPLYFVQLKELEHSVPDGEAPVHWTIWTDMVIENEHQALKIVDIYQNRWNIEELFSLLKTKGLECESAQVESGIAMKRLVIMAMQAALHLLQLLKDRDHVYQEKATLLIDTQDLTFVELLIPIYEGQTQKQKNPHPPESLARLAWLIGRMGGYSGYKSQSPPGPKTMRWGWRRFQEQLSAWRIVNQMGLH